MASPPTAAAGAADAPAAARARFLAAAAAVLVTGGLAASNGLYNPGALLLMTLAAAAAMGAAWPGSPWRRPGAGGEGRPASFWDRATRVALALGLAGGFASQVLLRPGKHLDPRHPPAFRLLAVAGALLAASWLVDLGPRLSRLRFPLLLAVFAAMGVVVLRASPAPPIDVFLFRQAGAEALARGEDPYLSSVANLYRDRPFYGGGGFAVGDRVTGFPYPPLVLLADLPFQRLLGDARLASLAAMLLAAWALRRLGGRDGELMGPVLLFQSRSFLTLEMAWTEPLTVAAFGLSLLALRRWLAGAPRGAALAGLAAGLTAASKQYTPLLLLPLLLAAPRAGLGRALAWTAAAFAAVVVPFVLWDPTAFWRGVVVWQLHQPFRLDALSWLAALARAWGRAGITAAPAFVAAGLALLAFLPRRPALFQAASAAAAAFLAFLLFNKQAFCNYYWGASGLLLVAAALGGREPPPSAEAA